LAGDDEIPPCPQTPFVMARDEHEMVAERMREQVADGAARQSDRHLGACGIPTRSRPLLLLSQPFGPALKPSISAVSDKR